MSKRIGRRTAVLQTPPSVLSFANIGGRMEGQGPLARYFDELCSDSFFGEKTWEKAESAMQRKVLQRALDQAGLKPGDLDCVLAGDLLNQCIGSSFSLRNRGVPTLGLYGACSTMAESLLLASAAVNAGYAHRAAALTSSHFASAERQYRFPLGYGGQRTPTAQWTATAAGCCVVGRGSRGPYVMGATVGRIVDLGIKDANNMGAAMAPAAVDTLERHFQDFGVSPADYDLIVTGDLGALGKQIVLEQTAKDGYDLSQNYDDCGVLLFSAKKQDVHSGGSGCGCSASVLCGYLLRRMQEGSLKNLLFCATGALLSPVSTWQGESIPGICHAVAISAERR